MSGDISTSVVGFGNGWPPVKEARILRVEPGDTIVLETDGPVPPDQADYMQLRARDIFGTEKVVILSGGIHAGVIRLVDGNEVDDD